MDEVDKIIIHSLRQIGCRIADDVFSLSNFTPELLVHTVAASLQEIKPQISVPNHLPEGMTQRFAVASTLAEACAAVGYRSDIGYQTFLYPNPVDARKLFMFLIEILPKDRSDQLADADTTEGGEFAALEREIKQNMLQSLHSPWVPAYCRQLTSLHNAHTIAQYVDFKPHLNLNIPSVGDKTAEGQLMQYLPPTIFQQTANGDFDIISSVLHKHDMDKLGAETAAQKYTFVRTCNAIVPDTDSKEKATITMENDEPVTKLTVSKTPLELLGEKVNTLKNEQDEIITERKMHNLKVNELKSLHSSLQLQIAELRKSVKMHERTCVVLEQPAQNVEKLGSLIQAAKEKRHTLEEQWQSYRAPLEQRMLELQHEKPRKTAKNSMDLRELIAQLETSVKNKTTKHAELSTELKRPNRSTAATRKEYTRRIMEFIGNIRKQRNDIYKVLDDTRDLQKQINTVSAQLQRQFNYTDDLLFKSAKHDAHSRRAYKLLAALHTACNELVELVSQTGNITKEIRDLEEHIDREKIKNIAVNLEKISFDIKNFENVIKSIQAKIQEVENRITEA